MDFQHEVWESSTPLWPCRRRDSPFFLYPTLQAQQFSQLQAISPYQGASHPNKSLSWTSLYVKYNTKWSLGLVVKWVCGHVQWWVVYWRTRFTDTWWEGGSMRGRCSQIKCLLIQGSYSYADLTSVLCVDFPWRLTGFSNYSKAQGQTHIIQTLALPLAHCENWKVN